MSSKQPVIKQKQLKNGWVKVVEGIVPIYTLPGNCRLRIRKNGRDKAIVVALTELPVQLDPLIIIAQEDTYKLEAKSR